MGLADIGASLVDRFQSVVERLGMTDNQLLDENDPDKRVPTAKRKLLQYNEPMGDVAKNRIKDADELRKEWERDHTSE